MRSDRGRPGVKSAEAEDGGPRAPAAVHRQLSMGMLTLSVREAIGLLVRFGGIIAIGRIIGPRNFGVYAVASGATFVASIIAQLGVEVFLIRHHSVPSLDLLDEIFSLLLVTTLGVGAAQASIGGIIFAGAGSHDVGLAVMVSSLAVPLNVLWSPVQGYLEHLMRYPALSLIEFVGDLLLYGVGIVAALVGWRYWAPVAGMFAWQAWLIVAAYSVASYRPRWRWNPATNRDVVRFGRRLLLSQLAARVKELFLPMVTGSTMGVQVSGFAQTSVRLVESAGFFQRLAARLVLSTGARLRGNEQALHRLLARATRIQIALTIVFTLPLTLFPREVVRFTLGGQWSSIAAVLPIFVLALLAAPTFTTVVQVLVVNDDLTTATRLNLLRSGTWGAATVSFGLMFGLTGVAVAEVLSVVITGGAAMWMLWRRSRTLPTPLIPLVLLAPLTMWTRVNGPLRWLLPLPAIALLFVPVTRGDISAVLHMGRDLLNPSDAAAAPPVQVGTPHGAAVPLVATNPQPTGRGVSRRSRPIPRHARSRRAPRYRG